MFSTRIASGTIRGSAVYIPSTSVQNSTRLASRQDPTMAAEKSEPFRPNKPGTESVSVSFFRQEQTNPGNNKIDFVFLFL